MTVKVWIKRKASDRVLAPLRKELIALIKEGSSVLEIGCGTGDLLFQSAHKISYGYGVDIDQDMIESAELMRKKKRLNNLSFECLDALAMAPRRFDIATSTLCLHELPKQKACSLLKMMLHNSSMVLVADYTQAKSTVGKISMEFDECISGHYRNYKKYRNCGGIPSYAKDVGAIVQQEIKSTIDGISIWCIVPNEEG